MGSKEPWYERYAAWFRSRPSHPIEVEPKQYRTSGPIPRVTSDDWTTPEYQELLGPQCESCHQNLVYGQTLVNGRWCATCQPRPFVGKRQVNGDDLPPAA